VEDALRMHSVNGAYASFEEKEKGSIAAGKLADLVLLDLDPTMVEPERIRELKVMMTMVGGEVAWQR
jgi:predicted amidohydrolase YtcJ